MAEDPRNRTARTTRTDKDLGEKEKVTIRLDPDVLADVRSAVGDGPGQTVTGYVQDAVVERVSRERRARDLWEAWGPFTDDELRFAADLLDGEQRGARPEHRAAS